MVFLITNVTTPNVLKFHLRRDVIRLITRIIRRQGDRLRIDPLPFHGLLIVNPGNHGVIVQWHDGPVDDEQASFQAHRILRAVPKRFDLINVFQVLDPPD